jgi:hypothetical protein
MGMHTKTLGVADCKKAAIRFLIRNYGDTINHCFADNQAFLDGGGKCALCEKECETEPEHPDLTVDALPIFQRATQQEWHHQ